MSGVLGKLKNLDAYPKINEDFFTKTISGGLVTIVSSIIMILLFLSEFTLYMRPNSVHELSVDTSRGETISIEVDVTFPFMPCAWLSLDTMDISGELHLDLDHDVYKQRLSASGTPLKEAEKHNVHATKKEPVHSTNASCMTCYGAQETEDQCCNTCDEVRSAYRKKGWALLTTDHIEQCKHDEYLDSIMDQKGEGCRMWGKLEVNKVAGNFHFAPGRSYQQGSMHVHDIAPFGDSLLDFTHTINKLSFGKPYPGMKNPLDGVKVKRPPVGVHGQITGMYQYFLKVVPTVYSYINNKTISTNQFSVTENFRESQPGPGKALPGVFFFFDLSPIKVVISEKKSSFLHFLTSVCAIVGGVFTVSGIVDAFIYQGEKIIRKKMELGKFT
ncbi:hypothetical protein CEUSTIGMA_g10090.t1 [Chlamydomonas eustigma]|uniref:Endoplasmic reticulum vesicle transporter C-terminal domain-containing protein n=1 Tax=Chlamydomonas eustigma TaxID=1157962 RepID=A0A250XHV9_9CHLO|nr:hypothetical protein CEUSTIGMA_g10090.t1 [Chlamydomonas eustigma]|eukprot:GAX82664.1 hypothetical protein CEUSTIGMA_g10090.t1 [Chlamydomonas eustigma]